MSIDNIIKRFHLAGHEITRDRAKSIRQTLTKTANQNGITLETVLEIWLDYLKIV